MSRLIRVTCLSVMVFVCVESAYATTRLIRTFKNGNPEGTNVRDLHIEYTQPLVGLPNFEHLLNPNVGYQAQMSWNSLRANEVHVEFNRDLTPGESVAIAATAPGTGIRVRRWWWTDSNGKAVPRTVMVGRREITYTEYPGTMRGDEDLPPRGDDPYAIINRSHHWGGADRLTRTVNITMNIGRFLQDAPEGINRDHLEAMIRLAVKQWVDATDPTASRTMPWAGNNGSPPTNPINQGPGIDPPVMAPGPTHAGANGEKFRSLTRREIGAARLKYPHGLSIELITDPKDKSGDIHVRWSNRMRPLGQGPSENTDRAHPDRTTAGLIRIRRRPPRRRTWHVAQDTNGDGYITNADGAAVANNEYDLYSIFKHELGHVLGFYHSGDNNFIDHASFGEPVPLGDQTRFIGYSPCPMVFGDYDVTERDVVYFADNRPDGFGGMDLYQAGWDGTSWTVSNLGSSINSAGDDVDPYLASDETFLVFASNRPGTLGGFDLYTAHYDLINDGWPQAENMGEVVNSPNDDRHPSLRADMGTLYFSSDRPGGLGGSDIFSSEFVPGVGFTQPANLGAPLNSAANEHGTISGDGLTCFFASDRPDGFGGYDLWVTEPGAGCQTPINLGEPINTPFDEVNPSIRLDDAYLCFSSDRREQGGDCEIYEVSISHGQGPPSTVVEHLGISQFVPPAISLSSDECTLHSNGQLCEVPQPPQKMCGLDNPLLDLSPAATGRIFDEVFPCGDGPAGFTVCASSGPPPPGLYVCLIAHFEENIPLNDPTHFYQYAFVFDADGLASNNYQPWPDFPNDWFDGTDKWYELTYSPDSRWQLWVTDVRQDFAEVKSAARFVIAGRELAGVIPLGEFDIDTPTSRVTAFAHTGDYGMSGGGPWSGDYWPLVGEPLLPVSRQVYTPLSGPPTIQNIQFEQVNWYGPDGILVEENSVWGRTLYEYQPGDDQTYYLNLTMGLPGADPAWVAQNVPLFAIDNGDYSKRNEGVDINLEELGITGGQDLSEVYCTWSVDGTIRTEPPTGPETLYVVRDSDRFAWCPIGESPDPGPFTGAGTPVGVKLDKPAVKESKSRDVKAVQEGDNKCFAGSCARSIDWLNREYGLGIGKGAQDIYNDLNRRGRVQAQCR